MAQDEAAAAIAANFQLTLADVIKDAQRIREFRGGSDYALSSFLREVDTILPLLNGNPGAKQYVFQRIVINKIQGPALDVIRTLESNATWATIRTTLIRNFGVKESYHSLYQRTFSLRNFNVSDYFYGLRKILDKLNEKYEYDDQSTPEFSPANNESIILKTFIGNIESNLATVILNKNIQNLSEAYYTLES